MLEYRCADGHDHRKGVRRRCPAEGCKWVGKEDCGCHEGVKLELSRDQLVALGVDMDWVEDG